MIDEKTQERLDLMDTKHELENDLYKIRSQILEIFQDLQVDLPIEVLFDVDDYDGFIEYVDENYMTPGFLPEDDEQALGSARNAMRQKLEKIAVINKSLAKPDVKKEPKPNATKGGPKPIVWLGTHRAFAGWVQNAFREKQIDATSQNNVFEQAVKHFVRKDGKPFKPKNLQQNLKNQEDELKP